MKRAFEIARIPALVAATTGVLLLATGVAFGLVNVYTNGFGDKANVQGVPVAGKGCDREWDKENGRVFLVAEKGPANCRLKVPVQGDLPEPDHAVTIKTKLEKDLAKSVAKKTYVSISVRDGSGGRYELRVYPALRRYAVVREPEGGDFPVEAREKTIGKAGEQNTLRLEVFDDVVKAKVNKIKVDPITDGDTSEVQGRRITLGLVVEGKSSEPVSAWFDDLVVQVPDP